jgi:hypothetical protein
MAEEHASWFSGGTHGYVPELQSMTATFIARGASFKQDVSDKAISNLDVYSLLTHLLRIEAAPNNGTLQAVSAFLRSSSK